MIVLGIDPSLNGTGLAVSDNGKIVFVETIKIKKLRGMERLDFILNKIKAITETYKPEQVKIEGYAFGARGRAIFQIGELGGVLRLYFYSQNIPVSEYAPMTLKKLTAEKGTASKDEMVEAVNKKTGLNLTDHNQADAVALALV